ncbi:MAG TPA: Ig-like domain-containing protein [Gaiellaceae bacterium]|nr:Ig-like domain-containing protein [Gaiellaceae bacterium]
MRLADRLGGAECLVDRLGSRPSRTSRRRARKERGNLRYRGSALAAAAALVVLALGPVGTAATTSPLVGDQAVEAQLDSDGAGTAEAFQATAAASGTIADLFVYVDGTAPAKLVAGVYSDSSGHPGTLLAQGTLTAPKGTAWNDVPLAASTGIAAGTKYWLTVLSPSGSGTIHFRDRKGSGASETSSATTLATLPTTWKTGGRYTDDFLSAYALPASGDTSPPTQPQSFHATSTSSTSVSTTWAASTDNVGVTGYDVYVGAQKVGTTTSTAYTFTGLPCGQSSTFGVVAFDAAGNRSAQAALAVTTEACPDTTAPTAPQNLSVTSQTASSVSLSWSASSDNVGVAGYDLYVDGRAVGTTTATGYGFTGLACGQSVMLGVAAFDAAGNTSATAVLSASTSPCADVTPPTTPTGLVESGATASSVSVSWSPSTDDVGVAGYDVFVDGAAAGTTTATSDVLGGLACGTSYTVGVQAFDAAGNVSGLATVAASTAACIDRTPPSQPTGFLVSSSSSTTISTVWSASTDDVGVAGYRLSIDGSLVTTVTSTSYTFAGVACGTLHTLGVSAYDAAGNTSQETTLSASTAACPDQTPPSVAITSPPGGDVSDTVPIAASASDNVGVASVQFFVDGIQVGSPVTSAPYSEEWDTNGDDNGTYTLTAVAKDAAGNSATSAPVTVTVSNSFDTTNALKAVVVGPGYTDASDREIVRTSDDRVYLFLADDTAQRKGIGPGVIHAYRADQTGIPTSFSEVDAAHAPSATGSSHVLEAPDVRLDRNGIVHLVYINNMSRNVVYQTFSTVTDTWGPTEAVGTNAAPITSFLLREGDATLVLGNDDVPRIVYSTGSSLVYRSRAGGTWSAPVTVASGGTPIHPQLACGLDGTLYLAWLQDGTSPTIDYASLAPGGTWSAVEQVASSDVLDNSDDDQGPSIVVTSAGVPYVLYVSAAKTWTNGADYGAIRVKYRTSSGWTFDTLPTDVLTHTPQIYEQNGDLYAFLGHDTNIFYGYLWQPAGGSWSPYTMLFNGTTVDGAATVRWDPQRETNAAVIDTAFYDEDINDDKTYLPRAYYMAVLPRGGKPSQGPDTTPPSVSVTAPPNAAALSGTVTLTASASDDVGVSRVQFMLDGAPLGAPDTSAPYSHAWDTTTAAAGRHTIAAVAWDAAGNSATSSSVTVTVDNSPPTVALTAPAAGTTVSGVVTVSAGASDDVGVAGVQFTLDGNPLGSEDTVSPYAVSWNTTLAANGQHVLGAVARDAAGNRTTAATVTITVANAPPSDTTPPTVALTAPSPGSVVSGTVTVSANASDNVGVVGVQFTLDGAALGAEDTSAPYSISWNTATVSPGSHALSAVARDAAGNSTTAASVAVTVTSAQPTLLVGDQSVESGADDDAGGQAEAFSYTATASGTVGTLHVYLDSASVATNVIVGLYAANGSHPGALLAQGAIGKPVSGWNSVSVPTATVTAGATYWLAVLAPSGAGTVRFRDKSAGGACEVSSQTSLKTLPSAWSSGTAYRNSPMSAYAG